MPNAEKNKTRQNTSGYMCMIQLRFVGCTLHCLYNYGLINKLLNDLVNMKQESSPYINSGNISQSQYRLSITIQHNMWRQQFNTYVYKVFGI